MKNTLLLKIMLVVLYIILFTISTQLIFEYEFVKKPEIIIMTILLVILILEKIKKQKN